MNRLTRRRVLFWLVTALLLLAAIHLLVLIRPVLSAFWSLCEKVLAPFFFAVIISYVLHPVVGLLTRRKVPRSAAVLIIYAVFIACVAVVLANLVPMFAEQVRELNERLPGLTMKAQDFVDDVKNNRSVPDSVRDGIAGAIRRAEDGVARFIGNLAGGIGETLDILFAAFIVPFLAFYMLKDYQMIERAALTFVPERYRRDAVTMLKEIDEALGNYVRGQFTVCLIIGIMAYVGYWLIGLELPLLLAGIVALFNIIPYLGPFFGAAPALLVASTESLRMVLLAAAVNLAVQVLEGNVISPLVVGRKLQMHPLVIIFVVLVGGEAFGIIGLILAVPAYVVLKVIVQHAAVFRAKFREHEPV
jgi:predicted PurR-regulated permease PerM